jgi:alpha-glucosidase
MPEWLKNAVFYEIYPQSFKDSNGDGIGDFNGITMELDYIKSLGCNALWINPCFDSPFHDAGYDVRDYKKAAPRYGTNEDLYHLFEEAHRRGIHVLLDLVPGHTSEEHEWFKESGKAEKNEYSGRYIWTDFWIRGTKNHPYIAGECERGGAYMLNFFKCQPALNYGFLHPEEDWQMPIDAPDCMATRDAMVDVCKFWLGHGADGFRVDMAGSLCKDDDEKQTGTCAIWQYILGKVREDYPESAFVSEWNNPMISLNGAGFDMDFYLDFPGNGYNSLARDYENHNAGSGEDRSFFRAGEGGDILRFLEDYLPKYEATKEQGYFCFLTCNHDTPRVSATLTPREEKIYNAMILTMPGVPFVYYGDEIGMRYIKDLPTKEGGYIRTGTRTPMQWNHSNNLGFSDGKAEDLYLPLDPASDAPTAEDALNDPDSLLCSVKTLNALRGENRDLQADGPFETVYAAKEKTPFVYRRGRFVISVNPEKKEEKVDLTGRLADARKLTKIYEIGSSDCAEGILTAGPQSFVIFRIG